MGRQGCHSQHTCLSGLPGQWTLEFACHFLCLTTALGTEPASCPLPACSETRCFVPGQGWSLSQPAPPQLPARPEAAVPPASVAPGALGRPAGLAPGSPGETASPSSKTYLQRPPWPRPATLTPCGCGVGGGGQAAAPTPAPSSEAHGPHLRWTPPGAAPSARPPASVSHVLIPL